jgi:hypothetical protein
MGRLLRLAVPTSLMCSLRPINQREVLRESRVHSAAWRLRGSYQLQEVTDHLYGDLIYLAKRWVRMGSRTRAQMEQSARSGKQNIVEGSLASATSKQTEIHLTNVARASLGELLEDYKDFLRWRITNVSACINIFPEIKPAQPQIINRGNL